MNETLSKVIAVLLIFVLLGLIMSFTFTINLTDKYGNVNSFSIGDGAFYDRVHGYMTS